MYNDDSTYFFRSLWTSTVNQANDWRLTTPKKRSNIHPEWWTSRYARLKKFFLTKFPARTKVTIRILDQFGSSDGWSVSDPRMLWFYNLHQNTEHFVKYSNGKIIWLPVTLDWCWLIRAFKSCFWGMVQKLDHCVGYSNSRRMFLDLGCPEFGL